MKRLRRSPSSKTAVIAVMLGALFSAGACGSSSEIGGFSGGCVAGGTRACVGPGRCDGGQLCDNRGQWGACDCGAGAQSGSGGASSTDAAAPVGTGGAPKGTGGVPTGTGGVPVGAAGGTSLGGAATAGGTIGRACEVDTDCPAPGTLCLSSASSDLSGGGPAHGLCTADCSSDSTACAGIDRTSICVGFQGDARAYCLESCSVGQAAPGTHKCHDRPDLACDDSASTAGSGIGFCRPVCRGDVDCAGRKCDIATGLCKDASAIQGTLPIGSGCDVTAVPDPCRGTCVPLSATGPAGMCTGVCSIGTIGCDKDPTSTAPLGAACLFDGTIAGAGDVGDIGICGALCDCDRDCAAPGRVCAPFPATNQAAFGRAGYCGGAMDSIGQPSTHLATCPTKR